jgi:hypothetical protein
VNFITLFAKTIGGGTSTIYGTTPATSLEIQLWQWALTADELARPRGVAQFRKINSLVTSGAIGFPNAFQCLLRDRPTARDRGTDRP